MRATCPSCSAAVNIPEGATAARFRCPRCRSPLAPAAPAPKAPPPDDFGVDFAAAPPPRPDPPPKPTPPRVEYAVRGARYAKERDVVDARLRFAAAGWDLTGYAVLLIGAAVFVVAVVIAISAMTPDPDPDRAGLARDPLKSLLIGAAWLLGSYFAALPSLTIGAALRWMISVRSVEAPKEAP